MFRLDGKKVVVVGGSAGIGLATAEMAIKCGAEVAIAARNLERLAAAAQALAARGKRTVPWQVLAIADRPAVAAFLATHAPFDHLVLLGVEGGGVVLEMLDERTRLGAFIEDLGLAFIDAAATVHVLGPLATNRRK